MGKYKFDGNRDFFIIRGINGLHGVVNYISTITFGKKNKSRQKKGTLSDLIGKPLSNAVIFICGGVMMGTKSDDYYSRYLKMLDDIGDECNIDFIIVRANGDDPYFFDGKKVHTKHVIAVEDYSTVSSGDKTAICIGGGLSINRSWLITHEPGTYFKDEMPKYKVVEDFGKIDYLVRCTVPSFIKPSSPMECEWAEADDTLIRDMIKERNVMDKVYSDICDGKKRTWYYSMTSECTSPSSNNITFSPMKKMEIKFVFFMQ